MTAIRETDLYAPIKAFLAERGFEVKSEVAGADIVAVGADDVPVIVEMKTTFSLTLFHQAIDRLAVSDAVYVAVPRGTGKRFQNALRENLKLCRYLGVGLLCVHLSDGTVECLLDPGPYAPRKSRKKQVRLMREFAARDGDPNVGGSRGQIMTAYRQDALRCALYLESAGETKGAQVAADTGVGRATTLMRDNHYGWFARVGTGLYDLDGAGREMLATLAADLRTQFGPRADADQDGAQDSHTDT